MKLYHWTRPQNLVGIAMSGLEPRPPYDETPQLTAGQSVVWLTANPSRDLEPADIEHMRKHVPDWSKAILFGEADDVRLTVRFNSANRRKLYHWAEWIRRWATTVDPASGEQFPLGRLIEFMSPSGVRDSWICLNRIPVSQIELPPITARVAMLGLKKDSEAYKQCAALPPETIVSVGPDR